LQAQAKLNRKPIALGFSKDKNSMPSIDSKTWVILTLANLTIYESGAPRLARPISCEKSANTGSANKGTCPSSSWQMSGSGVYIGLLECRMYCVEWKTRNASPAKKSRDDNRPATGRKVNPVQSLLKFKNSLKSVFVPRSCTELTLKEIRNIFQLRDLISLVTTVIDQQLEYVIEFLAGMCWIQLDQFGEYRAPLVLKFKLFPNFFRPSP
jgi:hypothetical protein